MSESTLTTTPHHELSNKFNGGINDEQFKLMTDTFMKGATPEELQFFGQVCERTNLDPFLKQIHPVSRWNNELKRKVWSFQVGIDGFRATAQRTGDYAGSDDAVFDKEEPPHPNKATVTVWKFVKGQRIPFTASARYAEYVQTTREGRPNSMWAKMPFSQLAKCAEALALRKAFPEALSGIHTDEEMAQADNPEGQAVNQKSSTANIQYSTEPQLPEPKPEPKQAKVVEAEIVTDKAPWTYDEPKELKPLIGGNWKNAEIDGTTLGEVGTTKLHALQEDPPADLIAQINASIIDEIRYILTTKEKSEKQLAEAAAEITPGFPAELWMFPENYHDLRKLAQSL